MLHMFLKMLPRISPKSIHIIGVNTETNENNGHLAVYANGHYL